MSPASPAPATGHRRLGLSWKFAAAFTALVGLALLINGTANFYQSYEDAWKASNDLQKEKAQAAARQIGQFFDDIVSQLDWITGPGWDQNPEAARRYDFVRMQRQNRARAITELIEVDSKGHQQLRLSRTEPDETTSAKDYSADPLFTAPRPGTPYFGPVFYVRGSEPYLYLSVANASKRGGVIIAGINLRFAGQALSPGERRDKGFAYIVDDKGRLVAHPDASLVLSAANVATAAPVQAALKAPRQEGLGQGTNTDAGLDGSPAVTAFAQVPGINWIVFSQLPQAQATASAYQSLSRTLALFGGGLLFAGIAGTLAAHRMVVPIRMLQTGAERLGSGHLDERIDIRTGDEIETLADRFNQMAGKIQEGYETLEAKVVERTHDLGEALRQQTATADVLKVISRSAFDLTAVLRTLIETGARLCAAPNGVVWLRRGNQLHLAASVGYSAEWVAMANDHPITPDSKAATSAALATIAGEVINVSDFATDPRFAGADAYRAGGDRSGLMVPLIRDGRVEGTIGFTRPMPGLFSQRQTELLQTFADQAVIAIENVRLFEETQTRSRELAASLADLRATQDRLIQSEKLASLGQLTAGIAHEIKNPLNFINNFADVSSELVDDLSMVLAGETDRLSREASAEIIELTGMLKGNLAKVVQHGRRADSIVKNMLLHSRSGVGEKRKVDLNATVEESLNLAYHGARAERQGFNITLKKELDPAVGEVEIFPQEFIRVLLNLISNGFYAASKRKAENGTPDYEPELAASTRNLGDRVAIIIRDNGTGIPDEVKAKMFNPFFTTKPAGEGTGLGLSLSYDIVKQHGGTIDVASEPGQYTQFTVTLPKTLPGSTGAA